MMSLRFCMGICCVVLWVAHSSAIPAEQCEDSSKPLGRDHAMIQSGRMVRHKLEHSSPVVDMIQSAITKLLNDDSVKNVIPADLLKTLTSNPKELLDDPMALLNDPALEPVREKILAAIKGPLESAVDRIGPLKEVIQKTGKNVSELVDEILQCSSKTACGDCTNRLSPCYWCAASRSCHPVGSQQLGFQKSGADCTESTCQSQWPSSSCKSAYCADGSSVGNDYGPCSGRFSCDACSKGNCFWCGISNSCHAIGSQFYDERCNEDNCQATKWYSSCQSSDCSKATAYQAAR